MFSSDIARVLGLQAFLVRRSGGDATKTSRLKKNSSPKGEKKQSKPVSDSGPIPVRPAAWAISRSSPQDMK
jgi:hypothetical protein